MSQTKLNTTDFTPLSSTMTRNMLRLPRFYFDPKFYGLENINPANPALLVGNHTIYGMLDVGLLLGAIHDRHGVTVRGLADHAQFKVPGWRDLISRMGIVEGTRENCQALMDAGQFILVFPGGAREVAKRKGESYKLTWKQRTGFAKIAIDNGYPIIPFASVGPDNCYDILVDADDVRQSMLGRWLEKKGWMEKYFRGGDLIMPLAKGVAFTPLPKPERFYFSFGKAINTKHYQGNGDDKGALWDLREKTARQIEAQIGHLLTLREQDTEKGFIRKWLA